ncbi:MAG: hypothetical protein ACREUG_14865 [Steroidobacteraceae bacterium]
MAQTPKRLVGPQQLAAAAATLYTVPAATKTVVRYIHVSNPTGAAVSLSMSIGADAAAVRIFDALAIAANSAQDFFCFHVLEAAEVLQGFASAAASLVVTVDGEERTP